MTEEKSSLSKSLIAEPRLWRLALRIDGQDLHVVAFSTIEEGSLIYRRIPLAAGMSRLKALEEAIYENPLLLSDFSRVYIVVETQQMLVVPTDTAAEADDCERMMCTAFPTFAGQIFPAATGDATATILMGLDADLAGFLTRTFISPRIAHNLSPLARYFRATSGKGNDVKMLVNLRPATLDIVAFDRGRLLLANTFAYREATDALYYILACRRRLGLNDTVDPLFIAGNAPARDDLNKRLREYIAHVAPVIFPSAMFNAGRDAMNAPFDLITMPLCE